MMAWIDRICAEGVRRPAYPADQWAEQFLVDRFSELGLERVRREPFDVPYWEPRDTALTVEANGDTFDVPCFALPFCEPTSDLSGELAAFDHKASEAVRGRIALYDFTLSRLPPTFPVFGRLDEGPLSDRAPAAARAAGFAHDPRRTFDRGPQILPFGMEIQRVLEPSMEAGALGFVGVLRDYPGGGCEYYVPYDAEHRPIPGVWIAERDGERLRALLAAGPVRVTLRVDALRETRPCHNIVGELPGADEECVVIGTHHDGPWASAVEDGSGMALVLAQAAYWARVPRHERPHRLLFLVNGGHMAGGAGVRAFLRHHVAELDAIVLEIHLEHAAHEIAERNGELVPTGEPETRWWFTTRNPALETAVWEAIEGEGLERSLLMTPDAIAPIPTTDGGPFHAEGVPLVNYLTAPFYLFDAMDTPDKIHRESLVPVTRATIRIVEATRGISAADMRAGIVT